MRTDSIAGFQVEIAGPEDAARTPLVMLLHGYDCFSSDLSPFAASLGLPLLYAFPQAPWPARGGRGGHAWWPIDDAGRAGALARGAPRDLSALDPPTLAEARAAITGVLDELTARFEPSALIVGGFSQGAMLSCDVAFSTPRALAGVVQLSGAPIRQKVWPSLYTSRRGLPVFIAHGRTDPDLSFAAAERFKGDLVTSGLDVTWLPFEGGHEVPLAALRGLKRFLTGVGAV